LARTSKPVDGLPRGKSWRGNQEKTAAPEPTGPVARRDDAEKRGLWSDSWVFSSTEEIPFPIRVAKKIREISPLASHRQGVTSQQP
jgi:hypothetical protein